MPWICPGMEMDELILECTRHGGGSALIWGLFNHGREEEANEMTVEMKMALKEWKMKWTIQEDLERAAACKDTTDSFVGKAHTSASTSADNATKNDFLSSAEHVLNRSRMCLWINGYGERPLFLESKNNVDNTGRTEDAVSFYEEQKRNGEDRREYCGGCDLPVSVALFEEQTLDAMGFLSH